jgi:transcriptional regulator with XRE-family HTH domain
LAVIVLLRSFSSLIDTQELMLSMSIVEWNSESARGLNGNGKPAPQSANKLTQRPLHRLSSVRRQQGLSQRNIARRLNIDISVARLQEEETSDLPLSLLYEWQKILEVPIAELLVDSDAPLSPPVMERARMIKVMKTVAAIVEKATTPSMKRLVQMLCDQLLEIMPELANVAPWHTIGQRRTLDEYGRVVERQLPDDMFRRHIK